MLGTNIIGYNQVNGVFGNWLKLDSSSRLYSSPVNKSQPVSTISLRRFKTSRDTLKSGLTFLWDSDAPDITIKKNHIKIYKVKLRVNKVEYIMAADLYSTTHDMKVPFSMREFSSSKIITYLLHVHNEGGYLNIGYIMIIGPDLMVQLCLKDKIELQILEWDDALVPMKELGIF